ncbi:MAG TPA: hypothetical protein VKH82_02145, partial [Candidatus Binatia bacterium]|nr:hypothetical protein [Candidatus Binatia bacterium]
MKHEDVIAILLGSRTAGPEPEAKNHDRRMAEEHVANCSDCWAVVRAAYELAFGKSPADAGRISALFGCDAVQDRLYLVSDLPAAEIRSREPAIARHIGWCLSCRERLAELIAVERVVTQGELEPLLAPVPRWRETVTRLGATVREVIGHAKVRVSRAAAVFT